MLISRIYIAPLVPDDMMENAYRSIINTFINIYIGETFTDSDYLPGYTKCIVKALPETHDRIKAAGIQEVIA